MLKFCAKPVALLGAALLGAALFGASATAKSPVVVELFTSQGCSSCPPAEAYMQDLAKRQDVIGLEFHVDYWDYIGWKDKFADPAFTRRQRSYVRAMRSRYAYTPQMVINGRTHAVGSDRSKVESIIRETRNEQPDGIGLEFHVDYWDYIGWKDKFADPAFTRRQRSYVRAMRSRYAYTPQMVINGRTHAVGSDRSKVESIIRETRKEQPDGPEVVLRREGQTLKISVGAAPAGNAYDVVFVTYDKPHETKVRRGENRGRTLVNANVVRVLTVVGPWSGQPVEYAVSLAGKKGDGGCAVIVQKRNHGHVVAAARIPFEP